MARLSSTHAAPRQDVPTADKDQAFVHEALLYVDEDDFLAGTVPFLAEGIALGEPVLVVVPEPRLRALRGALGPLAASAAFADMEVVGSNPARIIPAWRAFLDTDGAGGRPVRGIGEPIWAGRGADELAECHRHEALLNVAFANAGPMRLLCPYNVTALGGAVIDEAVRNHALITERGITSPSPHVPDPIAISRPFDNPLSPPPPDATRLAFAAHDLIEVRRLTREVADRTGLGPERTERFVLAANEIAANSVQHGGGRGEAVWWHDADKVTMDVTDSGRLADPLAGRVQPALEGIGGRGLWLANNLCDLVQIRVDDAGTVVRLHMRRPA